MQISVKEKNRNVRQIMRVLLIYSTLFFSAGLVWDLVIYIREEFCVLTAVNGATLLAFVLTVVAYRLGRISDNAAIFIQIVSIVLNLCMSNLAEAYAPTLQSREHILLNMCIYIIPILLSAVTRMHYLPLVLTFMGLGSYIWACVKIGDLDMLMHLPAILLIFIGTPIVLVSVINLTNRIEREKVQAVRQQEALLELLHLDPELLHLLETDRLTKKQRVQLLDKMDSRIRDTIVSRMRDVVNTEEDIVAALRAEYPTLTNAEMEVCRLIIEDKSIAEICEIRHVSTSTVTSTRSRLRTKMGLRPGESLRVHLHSIVNNALSAGKQATK